MPSTNSLIPIELHDDGMRVVSHGDLHGYPYVRLENPDLIANVMAERQARKMLSDRNFQKWG